MNTVTKYVVAIVVTGSVLQSSAEGDYEGAGCDRTAGMGGETGDIPYQLPDVFLSALQPRRGLFSASTP